MKVYVVVHVIKGTKNIHLIEEGKQVIRGIASSLESAEKIIAETRLKKIMHNLRNLLNTLL